MIVRFLLVQAVSLWQGGFLFYALVVVPIGSDTFSPMDQGFVTQLVTDWLNLLGLITLLLMGFELWHSGAGTVYRQLRTAVLLIHLFILFALAWLHHVLDSRMNRELFDIPNRPEFYALHGWYLTLSGVQWALMLIFTWLTLVAWRRRDTGALAEQSD